MTTIRTIQISCCNGSSIEILAVVAGNWAAHGYVQEANGVYFPSERHWTVTYVPTGQHDPWVVGSPERAVATAVALARHVPTMPEEFTEVRAVVDEIGRRVP